MFFTIEKALETMPKATTFQVVGQRGVGKSYSVELYCLKDAIFNDRQVVLVGRYKEDILPSIISQTFNHLTSYNRHTNMVPLAEVMKQADLPQYPFWSIESKAGEMWIAGAESETARPVKVKQLGVYTAIQQAERFKRGSYPDVYNIFFDEFITKKRYIFGRQEPQEFKKIVNTIARAGKEDYRIFMCGNPDNEIDHCPYLEHYNLDYDELEPGSLYSFDNGDTCFVKIAGDSDGEFIVKNTKTMFGMIDESSHSGEIDRPPTIRQPEGFADEFQPMIELRVETSAIAVDGIVPFRRAFYLYLGLYRGELFATTHKHRVFYCDYQIECKYDRTEVPPPDGKKVYIYRFNFPGRLQKVRAMMADCMAAGKIYHENDRLANVLNNIIIQM